MKDCDKGGDDREKCSTQRKKAASSWVEITFPEIIISTLKF